MNKIAVLMTCFNRRSKTLSCLDALFQNVLPVNLSLKVFLVDDGSKDGTGKAVSEHYPHVNVLKGEGNLYWNGGMRLAFDTAINEGFNYYLWLNDDTLIYSNTIAKMIQTMQSLREMYGKDTIVVGSTQNESDGIHTYGGEIRPSKWKPTSILKIPPHDDIPVECETMNGNCVLIPNVIVEKLGNLEKKFTHALGDADYGLRARKAGFSIWVMPGFAGTCSGNSTTGTFADPKLPLTVRLSKMMQPKGLPLIPWFIFTKRHAGCLWPIFWLAPYFKLILNCLVRNFEKSKK